MSINSDLLEFYEKANKLHKELGQILLEGPDDLDGDLTEKHLTACEKWADDLEDKTSELAVLGENCDIPLKVAKALLAFNRRERGPLWDKPEVISHVD